MRDRRWSWARNSHTGGVPAIKAGAPPFLYGMGRLCTLLAAVASAATACAATYGLSEREAEVFRYLAMGYGNERIAQGLGVKAATARTHTHNVYAKLDVHTREALMRFVDDAVRRQ